MIIHILQTEQFLDGKRRCEEGRPGVKRGGTERKRED